MSTAADEQLKELLTEIFLMEDEEYADENGPDQIEGWDSLSMIAVAVAVHERFGHHMTPAQVAAVRNIGDIRGFLRDNGVGI